MDRRWDFVVFVQNGHACKEHLPRWGRNVPGRRGASASLNKVYWKFTNYTRFTKIKVSFYRTIYNDNDYYYCCEICSYAIGLELFGKDQLVVGSQPLLPAERWRGVVPLFPSLAKLVYVKATFPRRLPTPCHRCATCLTCLNHAQRLETLITNCASVGIALEALKYSLFWKKCNIFGYSREPL